jgi:serine protease Do
MKLRNLAASLIAAGLIGSTVGYSAATLPFTHTAASTANAVSAGIASNATALPNFAALVAKYGLAVVNISVTEEALAVPSEMPQLDPDDPFYPFFKRFQIPVPRQMPVRGIGSGFIVRSDGVILTNAHVVDGAKEVDVKLTDKRELKAKVIGVDRRSDVAVLKVDAQNLPTVKLGKAADVKVGQWVVAIGSPFGFENSVTQGIVSAKFRNLPDETYVPFIQTDVPVNPGNSGGPLVDLNGDVVGINSQIYSHSGGYEGLSFAIPIDIAVNVENQLLQHGKVTRGRLGVTIQAVTQGLADSFGLDKPTGALVSTVEPGSAAASAGLRSGDVILKLNDKDVADAGQLPAEVAAMKPGTSVKLEVLHKGARRNINVTLGELKDTQVAAADAGVRGHGRLGLAVRPLTPEERSEAGDNGGVLVEEASGAAARAGIQPGDVIVSVNGTSIKSAKQLRELVRKAGHRIALLVQRDEVKIFVPMDLG